MGFIPKLQRVMIERVSFLETMITTLFNVGRYHFCFPGGTS
jgi:hypothetical protein